MGQKKLNFAAEKITRYAKKHKKRKCFCVKHALLKQDKYKRFEVSNV